MNVLSCPQNCEWIISRWGLRSGALGKLPSEAHVQPDWGELVYRAGSGFLFGGRGLTPGVHSLWCAASQFDTLYIAVRFSL